MAVSFLSFPWRFWSDGRKENPPVKNLEPETVKFKTKKSPAEVIDKEFDIVVVPSDGPEWSVVVPSDGVHLSGYESDGREWSIGWEEPHGAGFRGRGDDDGFAVLVPSYKPGCKELVNGPNNQFLSAIENLPNGFSHEGSNSLQHWFSSSRSR